MMLVECDFVIVCFRLHLDKGQHLTSTGQRHPQHHQAQTLAATRMQLACAQKWAGGGGAGACTCAEKLGQICSGLLGPQLQPMQLCMLCDADHREAGSAMLSGFRTQALACSLNVNGLGLRSISILTVADIGSMMSTCSFSNTQDAAICLCSTQCQHTLIGDLRERQSLRPPHLMTTVAQFSCIMQIQRESTHHFCRRGSRATHLSLLLSWLAGRQCDSWAVINVIDVTVIDSAVIRL